MRLHRTRRWQPDDRTVAEVPLDAPVGPGETINVQIAWTSRVPRTFARTGVHRRLLFPRAVVSQDRRASRTRDGTVTSSTPHRVLCRLRQLRRSVNGADRVGRRRHRTSSASGATKPTARRRTTTTRKTSTTSPGRRARTTSSARRRSSTRRSRRYEMRLLLQPEHAGQADRHFAATRAALKYYGEWFGAYPYGHVTIVDPAWQSGAGGMEYPTLFTAGTALACAAQRRRARRASRFTRPATNSGTASSRTTSSSTRGWTRASTRSPLRA